MCPTHDGSCERKCGKGQRRLAETMALTRVGERENLELRWVRISVPPTVLDPLSAILERGGSHPEVSDPLEWQERHRLSACLHLVG